MVSNDVTVLYYVSPFVLVMAVLIACTWMANRSDSNMNTAYAALHSPSVRNARNAFDRRVALAMREAKMGCRVCDGCEFTNAMRATSCVLCGVSLELEQKEMDVKAAFRVAWSGKPRQANTLVVQDSTRQRRIRRRREWTRRLNEKGDLVWYHDEQFSSTTSRQFPSYVLRESSSNTPIESSIGLPEPTREASQPLTEVVIDIDANSDDTQPSKSLSDVSNEIQSTLQHTSFKLEEATAADASQLAFSGVSPLGSLNDSAAHALLDFPTKLAHYIISVFSRNYGNRMSTSTRLSMARSDLFADSLTAVATMTPEQVRSAIRVEFLGEQGIDAGGVYREWLVLLNDQIFTPAAGVFVCVDTQSQVFFLNPHSCEMLGEDHLAYILAAGRLLGRALLEGNGTGYHLALPLLKIILGLPIGFGDLEYFDPESFKSLRWLLNHDGVDDLSLNFTVMEKLPSGATRIVELVPGGNEVDVTDTNKLQFVDCKLKYLLFESVRDQLMAFLTGLYEVVPAELLMMFDAEELDYLLAGSDEIDVDDWEAHTLTTRNLASQPCVKNFWKVVRELSQDERRRLLQFATGSTRAPPGGFSALTSYDGKLSLFTLRGVLAKSTRGYLHSHACFNRVDLPMHTSLKAMRRAIHAAITCETSGFTTD